MLPAIATSLALIVAAQQAAAPQGSGAGGPPAPTRVRLDFRDRTLAEIVEGINAQGPRMLAIRPEGRGLRFEEKPAAPPRRFSVVEPGPVTFWRAVDRVGRATETWAVSGNLPGRGTGILLAPASADRGFACHDGAFRVVLTGTSMTSRFQFAPYFYNQPGLEPPRADGSSRRPVVSAHLLVMAEPRLRIVGPVELVVRVAVDDRGRSLIPATPWRTPLEKSPARSYPNQDFLSIPLRYREDPAGRIGRLAGRVTLEVAEDRPGAPAGTVDVAFDFADVPLP